MRCDAGGKTIEAESARCRLRRNESSVKRKGFVMYNYEWENGAIIRKRSEESEWQVTKLQKYQIGTPEMNCISSHEELQLLQ